MDLPSDIQMWLEKYGWYPQRKIGITEIIKILTDEGYQLNKYAIEIIERYGNLEILHPSFKVKDKNETMHLNPLTACNHIYREKVEDYESRTKESLVVIGEAYNGYLVLMVSDNGSIYGGYDDYLTLLGKSFSEALDAILNSKETAVIN